MSERRYKQTACEVVAINGDKVGVEAYERFVCGSLSGAMLVANCLEAADEYSSITVVYGAEREGIRNEQND